MISLGCLDKVISLDENTIVASKGLTINEDFLMDHFPEYPVMPGVLMIQTALEASEKWLEKKRGQSSLKLTLKEVINVRFSSFLMPGDVLTVEVTNRGLTEGEAEFQAKGKKEETVAFSLRFKVNYSSKPKFISLKEEF